MSDIWESGLLSPERENSSDFERQSTSGKIPKDALAVDEIDSSHAKMMVFELFLEAYGERNIRSINLTPGDYPSCTVIARLKLFDILRGAISG